MTIRAVLRPAAALVLVLAVAGCAEKAGGTSPSGSPGMPQDPGALVLRVESTGGFATPQAVLGRLPIASVYADGRLIVQGPVAAIYPPFAWPNVQVIDIGRDRVGELAAQALEAGVAESGDLGSPPIADATSTRFTLVTDDGTSVREVYALTEGASAGGLTADQVAARQALLDLATAITDLSMTEDGDQPPTSYEPTAIAVLAQPWVDPQDGLQQPELAWPGPTLPGEPIGGRPDLGCVVATGDEVTAVQRAAAEANAATPWVTPDGSRWSIVFRPLLPDEDDCADLLD